MAVESFELRKREPYAEGRAFGPHGAYERIEGTLTYAVDPTHAANARIVDLELAPRDADGRVRFVGRLSVLRPTTPGAGNGTLLVDVPNRGRRLSLTSFNRVARDVALLNPLAPGDGHLFELGYTLATVGWQWDVPRDAGFWCEVPRALRDGRPLRGEVVCLLRPDRSGPCMNIAQLGAAPYAPFDLDEPDARLYRVDEARRAYQAIPRAHWRFAREDTDGVQPDGAHVWLRDGFEAGAAYLLVFRAEGAPVVGCGLLAVRDAARWLRAGPFGEHAAVLGFGVSQTGRFLRQFLHEGMNAAEDGTRVFDGIWAHIAGAQRGDFNHRFAQPSSAGAASFGQAFPFAVQPHADALGGEHAGLADRCRAAGAMPRVFFTNTAWEYWRGDAALAHVGTDGVDLPPDPDVRVYAIAGTQHIGGVFPPSDTSEIVRGRYPFSVVDFAPLMRGLLQRFDAWVRRGEAPPASAHPRVSDGTAVTRAQALAAFAGWPALVRPDPAKLTRLHHLALPHRLQGAQHVGDGHDVGHTHYPVPEGAAYPALVSAVDDDGNEVAGIRLPEVAVPVGTHTGWNPRHADDGGHDIAAIFVGFTRFFAPNEAARAQAGDPRRSIAARYADRSAYEAAVRDSAAALVAAGLLLAGDVDWVVAAALAHHDHAVAL